MANTLTNLIPDVYAALDVVSRELVGFIPAVTMDAGVERAAVGQQVRVPITPAAAAENITPGQLPPDTGDQVIDNTPITITKARAVPFRWTGEEQRGINTGPGYPSIRVQQIAQAIRTLCNEIEADLAGLYPRASRGFGSSGSTPFLQSTVYNLGDAAQVLKILKDNGCPESDLHLIIDTAAGVNLRQVPNLTRANEAGGDTLLRQGILLDIFGMAIRESAQVKLHTPGTGAAHLVNDATGLVAGETAIAVDTGTGTILAGDAISFTSSTNVIKYIVATALAAGSFTINRPGIVGATVPDNNALLYNTAYRANMAFHRSAMVLAVRPPAVPEEGDMAVDRMLVTDPRSGLTFEVAKYLQYRRVRYEIAAAWGVANIKPEHTAILLG
jgi:coat protein Gp5